MKSLVCLIICASFVSACGSTRPAEKDGESSSIQISALKLLDEYHIPHKLLFQSTQVGGLSGIDYDAIHNRFYIISDDRSNINTARFYTADIRLQGERIDTIAFNDVNTLKDPLGKFYPPHKDSPLISPDPESIRFNPNTNTLIWSSEGERQTKNGKEILQQPFIYEMNLNGKFLDSFFIPANLTMQPGNKGPRRNSVFEGISFTKNFNHVFVSCEEPLLQDGSAATLQYHGALTRITKFNHKTKKPTAQFAYPLDAIAHPPKPASAFAVNGISEILCINEQQLLVVERSFSTGRLANTIKIFLADISAASNVLSKTSLATDKKFKPARKKLIFNSDNLKRYFDNVEGICFGPVLDNGNRSLIIVVDDNFNPLEKTQVFLFEILP